MLTSSEGLLFLLPQRSFFFWSVDRRPVPAPNAAIFLFTAIKQGWSMMQATTQIVREETTIMAISLDEIMEVRKNSFLCINYQRSVQCSSHQNQEKQFSLFFMPSSIVDSWKRQCKDKHKRKNQSAKEKTSLGGNIGMDKLLKQDDHEEKLT